MFCYQHLKNESWKHPPWMAVLEISDTWQRKLIITDSLLIKGERGQKLFSKVVYQQKSGSLWGPITKKSSYSITYHKGSKTNIKMQCPQKPPTPAGTRTGSKTEEQVLNLCFGFWVPQRHGGRAVREHPLEEVYLQQGLEGSEMENLHRQEKGGQYFRRGNNRSQALKAVIN